jgi:hypothetical protein
MRSCARTRTVGTLLAALGALTLSACFGVADHERRRPVTTCRVDAQCPAACWCDGGRCEPGSRPGTGGGGRVDPQCTRDADCAGGRSCRAGVCQPEERFCGDARDCWSGEVCERWTCQAACTGDADCAPLQTCHADGHCRPELVACFDLWDCAPGEVCGDGSCQPAEATCVTEWDCAPGRVCLHASCVPERPCAVDDDCPDALACADGVACVRPADRPAPTACDFDYECPAGLRCEEDGRCLNQTGAIPCTVSATCPDAGVCLGGRCTPRDAFECFSRLDCADDEICLDGFCVAALPYPGEPDGGDGSDGEEPPALGDGLCAPGLACGGIEYCYDTCFGADCCIVVCNCDSYADRLYCNLYCGS